jgi:hypothetical protein
MKTQIKVFGLKEEQIIRSASLHEAGMKTESELAVTRHHVGDFDCQLEAIEFIKETSIITNFEHGFELLTVFI